MKASKKKSAGSEKSSAEFSSLEEFETKDLGDTLKTYKHSGRWVVPSRKTRPTSIALSEETIQVLRQKAARKGIGYQTLLKMIVQEHLQEY